jgi:hypothetical protein
VERLDERVGTVTEATHPGLDDAPPLVVAWEWWLDLDDRHGLLRG